MYVRDFKNNVQIVFQFTADERYLSQSVCCLMMYDITAYETFSNLKTHFLEQVQSQMLKDCSFLYLVGNKMDLDQEQSEDDKCALRQVEFDEAQEFAQTKGLLFNEVSSLKRKNIELVLKMLRTRTARMLAD